MIPWVVWGAIALPFLARASSTHATMARDYFGALSVPDRPLPRSPLPGLLPAQAPQAPNPREALAARTCVMLTISPPGAEPKDLVRAFQSQEGLKASGYYNPSTALALTGYGLVPPPVRYWNKTGKGKQIARLRDRFAELAAKDPVRREEWLQAAAALR